MELVIIAIVPMVEPLDPPDSEQAERFDKKLESDIISTW
jgi:hypothetical protein